MTKTLVWVLASLLFGAANLCGWGNEGHMLVAEIAYQNLTPEARTAVATLLKSNPNYAKWIAGVPAASRDEVAFLNAAVWPDFIKSAPGYMNDGDLPKGPDASRNIGYSDKLQHRYFHFIDTPFSPDGTALVQPVAPNAQTQIAVFRATLASDADPKLKSYDLVWLIHIVGDVHQPLHATSRFDGGQLKGDAGGNKVNLCANCRSELHGFWDDVPGTNSDPKAVKKAAAKIAPADPAMAAISDEAKWIEESFEAAQESVYVLPVGVGAGPFTLTAAYRANARKVAQGRIALAGVRLANLINSNLR